MSFRFIIPAFLVSALGLACFTTACSNDDDDDPACGSRPIGSTCKTQSGTCEELQCIGASWVCPSGEDEVALTPASCTTASSDGGTTPSDSGSCQDVPDDGMNVSYQAGTGTPPAAAGGTIASGTYTLTSEVTYAAGEAGLPLSSLGTIRSTLVVVGSTVSAYVFASVAGSGTTANSTFTTNGTELTLVDTCPDTASTTVGYTATATTVALINLDASGDTTVSTYTML